MTGGVHFGVKFPNIELISLSFVNKITMPQLQLLHLTKCSNTLFATNAQVDVTFEILFYVSMAMLYSSMNTWC